MSHLLCVVLPFVLLLHASCKRPVPSRTSGGSIAPATHEGYVDAGGGVQLFYRMVGASPDPVVVLHGGPGFTMDYFAADLEPLAGRYALLFYDQRGTGRSTLVSDSTALDAQRFAEDLEALRRHFRFERLTLLGHSWGAGVAALYAARHPDRVGRLLIVGGIPLRRQELSEAFQRLDASRDSVTRRQMQEWREARLANPGDATACRAYYALWFHAFYGVSGAASRSKGDFCAGTPEALRNKIVGVDRFTMPSLGEWDWRPSLRGVTAPALVIHGTADVLPVTSARAWAAALPNARLLLLEGIGHFPYLEAPEIFFSAIDEFLQGRWPEGTQAVAVPAASAPGTNPE
jgi:proline iminopeptidase